MLERETASSRDSSLRRTGAPHDSSLGALKQRSQHDASATFTAAVSIEAPALGAGASRSSVLPPQPRSAG
eukprot:15458731-Alexandrium_andersonii.AAC.1